MNRKQLEDVIASQLQSMMMSREIEPGAVPDLMNFIVEAIDNWQNSKVEELMDKVKNWEEAFDGTNENFYSLGLRHAIDSIRENDHKPLDGKDYRDVERKITSDDFKQS
jgi:translation initiation factor 2B subunit (eIF-2B alpha/beta/delta family)